MCELINRNSKMALLSVVLVMAIHQCIATNANIRRNGDPYMYKDISIGRPVLFPSEIPTVQSLQKKKMMMMLGTAPEDLEIDVSRRQASQASSSLLNPTPIREAENTVDDMVDVMVKTEGEGDPLLNELLDVAEEINNSQQVTLRTASANSDNETASVFMDRVKELLAASGIDAVLPLDCGRNPNRPSSPLARQPLPWIAALGSREDGRFHYRCTGAVISNFHILTDAECVTSPNINIAQLNITDLVPEPFAIEAFVVGRRIHPKVTDADSFLDGYNIGILELAHPLEFNDFVQPICLPGVFDKQDPDEVDTATLIGFDNINDSPQGRTAGIYTWSSSKTFGAAACYTAIRRFNKENPDETSNLFSIITKNHICVDRPFEEVGKSVVVKEDSTTGRVQLIGVGPIANARKTNPIAYTLAQPNRFWIELVLKKFRDNTQSG